MMGLPTLAGLRAHIVALVAASLLPACAVGAIAVWAATGSYRQAFDDRMEGTAKALANAVETEIAAHVLALSTLATARELDPDGDLISFHARARQVAAMFGTRIFLLAPDLSMLLQTHLAAGAGAPARPSMEASDTVRQVFETGRPAIGHLQKGRVTGRWLAPAFVPVARDDRVLYTLGIAVEPERISRTLAGQTFRDGGYATLIDGNGKIIARSAEPEQYIGQTVRSWVTEGTRQAEFGTLRGPNRSGIEVVTAFRRISGTPGWSIIVAEPVSAYFASLQRPLATLALGGVASVLIALAVAIWIGRRILRPIEWLTDKAERVAASGGAAEIVPDGPPVRVQEFERLRAALLQAHVALRERTQALTVGEARLRAVVDTAADAIVVTDDGGTMLSFNRAAEATFGYTAAEAIGQDVAILIDAGHGAHHTLSLATYSRSSQSGAIGVGREVEGLRKDGSVMPLDLSIADWQDVAGERFFTVIMRDISARKATEARQEVLVREVDHRSKNILAVVQSILHLSPKDNPGAFAAAEKRIAGLARVHSLLAEGGWSGADLSAVVKRELEVYGTVQCDAESGATVSLVGPPIALVPSAVQPVAMVLHELGTNAAKHGALTTNSGRVEVRWTVDRGEGEDRLLRLRWTESGGPLVSGPSNGRGFGTRVIEATARGQLGGFVKRRWEPTGLVVEIAMPISRVMGDTEAGARVGGSTEVRASAA